MTIESSPLADRLHRTFVLQEIPPGLLGLMDGSVSTLAPIFAAAGLTGQPLSALFGAITEAATGLGGMLHTFPFLIPTLGMALKFAYAVVVCELFGERHRIRDRRLAWKDRSQLRISTAPFRTLQHSL
jgi:hypothetical protein